MLRSASRSVARVALTRSMHTLARPALVRSAVAPALVHARPCIASLHSSSLRAAAPAGSSVKHVSTDDDLRAALESAGTEKLVVVDWSAAWCGPCKNIAPIYEALAAATPGVVFVKADIDELQDASVEAGVQSVPTFHFIKNNELVAEFTGADQVKLKELVKKHA